MNTVGFNNGFGAAPMLNSGTSKSYYYNFEEFGELKPAKYKNLVNDLSDNSKSMFHLNKYKKATTTSTILFVVGGVLGIVGVTDLIGKTENVPTEEVSGTGSSIGLMVSGAITAGIGAFMSSRKQRHIDNAIDSYNEEF